MQIAGDAVVNGHLVLDKGNAAEHPKITGAAVVTTP